MDYPNNNTKIKYNHRNLITEFTRQDLTQELPITDVTKYKYDEAGNRTRKTVFLSEEYDPPPFPEEEADLPPGWTIIVDDYYSRDVAGREIMVYSSYTLQYWNVWSGNEITGRINYAGNSKYYYLKDHLGSVRAVLDEGETVISANDYDMWGYYLENRTYEPYTTKNKFTGKERDNESTYDYFGARYYDSRVGRWGATDPLFEKHIQFTPYNYVLCNPMVFIDPDGKDPRREKLVNSNIIKNTLNNMIGKTLYDVYNNIGEQYLFTMEAGILDMKHLYAAAYYSNKINPMITIGLGEIKEITQYMSLIFGSENTSGFNPEDPPSNKYGAILGTKLSSVEIDENSIDQIMSYLTSLDIVEPNEKRISDEIIYIPSNNKMIKLPNRNIFSNNFYDAYYGEIKEFYDLNK